MGLFDGTQWQRPVRCETCGKLDAECDCPAPAPLRPAQLAPEKQIARLAVEKRAKGKFVTVVRGLAAADNDLADLLKRLKAGCGAGGSIDGDVLEVQGKHVERIKETLQAIGYRVK
jgi:translation initiation factor 1